MRTKAEYERITTSPEYNLGKIHGTITGCAIGAVAMIVVFLGVRQISSFNAARQGAAEGSVCTAMKAAATELTVGAAERGKAAPMRPETQAGCAPLPQARSDN